MAKDKDGKEIVVDTTTVQTETTGVTSGGQEPMIPKSRLDEVLEKNRVLLEKQTKRDEADAKKQKEEDEKSGNFKKLAEDAEQRAKDAETRLQESKRYNLFLMEASKVDIIDPELAYKALPAVAEGEKMDELVATLIEEKAYLVSPVETKNGVPIVKSGGGGKPPKTDPKVALQIAYAEAMKNHNMAGAIAIKRQIADLSAKT